MNCQEYEGKGTPCIALISN